MKMETKEELIKSLIELEDIGDPEEDNVKYCDCGNVIDDYSGVEEVCGECR